MQSHRQEVRQAILDAVGQLVEQQGLLALTMSEVAERAGIGRATLYKYFPDVQTLLAAWAPAACPEPPPGADRLTRSGRQPGAQAAGAARGVRPDLPTRSPPPDSQLGALLHQGPESGHVQRQLQEVVLVLTGLMAT